MLIKVFEVNVDCSQLSHIDLTPASVELELWLGLVEAVDPEATAFQAESNNLHGCVLNLLSQKPIVFCD
jgi:hypothetical protein